MGNRVLITQSNYIPWKGYFDAINTADVFVIYDEMQYTRRDWRNRNRIKTPQGSQWLTIPVEVKGKFFQKINETVVSDQHWREKHWHTIQHNYSKTPYFSMYKELFRQLYMDGKASRLSEVNVEFLRAVCGILGINTSFRWSTEFQRAEGRTERLVSICKELNASDYYTGPAAKDYIDEELFSKANIKLNYLDFTGYPEYRQLYGEFDHFVSIIDLLFNEGPHATKYMKSF